MKIFDILTENQEMTEAPMGTFSKLGNKIASTFGSGKATGKLETGKVANELRKEFDVYLGKNGEEATPETAIEFLKSKGYPTTKAQQASGVAPRGPVPAGDNSTSQSSQHSTPASTPTNKNPVKDTSQVKAPSQPAPQAQDTQDITQTPAGQAAAAKRKQKQAAAAKAAQANMANPATNTTPPASTTFGKTTAMPTNPMQTPTAPTAQEQPAAPAVVRSNRGKPLQNLTPAPQTAEPKVKPHIKLKADINEDVIDDMFLAAAQEASKVRSTQSAQSSASGQQTTTSSAPGVLQSFQQGLSGQSNSVRGSGVNYNDVLNAARSLQPNEQRRLISDLKSR